MPRQSSAFWDIFVPQSVLDATDERRRQHRRETAQRSNPAGRRHDHYEVKKRADGRNTLVGHRPKPDGEVTRVHQRTDEGSRTKSTIRNDKKDDIGNGNEAKKGNKKNNSKGKGSQTTDKKAKDNEGKKGGGKIDTDGSNNPATKTEPNAGETGELKKNQSFTPQEDDKLKELKAGLNSFKNIAREMGKTQAQIKERWKEIDTPAADVSHNKGSKEGNKQKSDRLGNGTTRPQQLSEQVAKGAKKDSLKEVELNMSEWRTLQDDSLFSYDELQYLSELIVREETQKWDRIAGTFFDATGRRVHEDDIRARFEVMGEKV